MKFILSFIFALLMVASYSQEATCLNKVHSQTEIDSVNQKILKASFSRKKSTDIYTVPLVFHVIHKGEAVGTGTNISDEQILSAIESSNEDFRKIADTNGDGNGVDTHIEFCLMQQDDEGNPSTGIYRVNGAALSSTYATQGINGSSSSLGESETVVKSWSIQDNQHVYNVWIVSEIDNNGGGSGIQGYAYFPTTSIVDGTVILFNAIGTTGVLKSYTNMNRTFTHELGHALALFHTFQGGSCSESNCNFQGDRVCDTDPHPQTSSCFSALCGGNVNADNYMGYTSETCKNAFTDGQRTRMRLAYENSRDEFITSLACVPVTALPIELLYFDAKCGYPKLKFAWATASELNNDYFTIEGSDDLIEWVSLDTISGAGTTSSQTNYSQTYSSFGYSYYRLTQCDFNGECEQFKPIKIKCKNSLTRKFYNFIGEELNKEPTNGFYIIRYSNNKYEKIFK